MSPTASRPRVAVLGGGIFGITAALALAKTCDVTLFERSAELLSGASMANHNRQHFGFHYPRSPETALQCLRSHGDFIRFYGKTEVRDFPNFYAIAKEGTKVSPDAYLEFARNCGLTFVEQWPEDGMLDRDRLALCLKVDEAVCDLPALRACALERLASELQIQVLTGSTVGGVSMPGSETKRVEFTRKGVRASEDFDVVVNATYANYNNFCEWLDLPRRKFQFNLQELCIIQLPAEVRLGLTIMDGVFPSFLPYGRTPYHILAHVEASQLVRESSLSSTSLLNRTAAIESNWNGVLEVSTPLMPILKKARYIKSLFTDRVVDADAAATDARLTDLVDHGRGCYSIFAAKIITCVTTAEKLASLVNSTP